MCSYKPRGHKVNKRIFRGKQQGPYAKAHLEEEHEDLKGQQPDQVESKFQ